MIMTGTTAGRVEEAELTSSEEAVLSSSDEAELTQSHVVGKIYLILSSESSG